MAWLEKRSGLYRIAFRYGGRRLHHSLNTNDRKEATGAMSRLEENLRLLERGRIELPPGADLALFLVSDGKVNQRPTLESSLTLKELFERYNEKLPSGAKEENTRYTERIHIEHLLRLIGPRVSVRTITTETLQSYVDKRALEAGRHETPLSHATIQKEISTLGSIWNKWAAPLRLVSGPAPTRGLIYSKSKTKPPFQTLAQVEKQIARGGLTSAQEDELWESVFLTIAELEEILAYLEEHTRFPFIYPMFVFAAHTGARRSEILRSRIDDFDFDARMVRLREKKRDRRKEVTFRHVPISPLLAKTMAGWLARHPGGQLTVCREPAVPITPQMAAHYFVWALEDSRWKNLRGWHVFRHSFISNCAAKGVDQRIIDAWSGHQTEEMRRRYTHLFPDQHQKAIELVFTNTQEERLRLVAPSKQKARRRDRAMVG